MKRITILFSAFSYLILAIGCSKSSSGGGSTVTIPPNQPVIDTIAGSSAAVDLSNVQQIIRGFGGASVFLPALTDGEMTTLYGNTGANQLGLSILRIRIDPGGASAWGTELGNARKAASHGAIVMATPWSPPASMKSNANTTGGSLNPSSFGAYASYLDSFARYMSANGAPLYAISVQNEPDISVTYESCNWAAGDIFNFVKNNGGAIVSTRLIAAESYHFDQSYTDQILGDSTASSHLSIVAGHIYGGGLASYPLAVSKGKEVWMTEHLDTNITWSAVLGTAKEINDCLVQANFSAYNWWYLKRFYGPMDDNDNPTKRGFIMAQFSKYIRPGYQRVNVPNNPTANVYVSAYKNGTSLIIVAINMGTSTINQPFTISGGTLPASFTPHITNSGTKSLSTESNVNVSITGFSYVLGPQSVTTFVSN